MVHEVFQLMASTMHALRDRTHYPMRNLLVRVALAEVPRVTFLSSTTGCLLVLFLVAAGGLRAVGGVET